ncbi:retrovirus-related pol polyprotein from transposon TNT 1-94, partial [Tanacetum coccineum]
MSQSLACNSFTRIEDTSVFKSKFKPDGSEERKKAILVVREIYMLPPQRYDKAVAGQVCKLNRSLYGLKQASRQWNHKLTKFLVGLGYVQSKHDYSLFVRQKQDTFTVALVYVDDVLITGNSVAKIVHLKQALDKKFTIKDLGLAKYFLGMELCCTSTGTHLNQRKYIVDLLFDIGLTAAKPTIFPLPTKLKLSLDKVSHP